jgi:phosphopantetheinyl transferase
MPLVYSGKNLHNTLILVWQQTETLSFFLENIDLDTSDTTILDGPNKQRQINGIVLKYLLQQMVGAQQPFKYKKDEFGKPFLINDARFISVSHSKNTVAAILSDVPCGIDIQFFTEKVDRIATKFINAAEFDYIEKPEESYFFHILWGAKEALYKSDGKRGLDFKRNLIVSPFNINDNGKCEGIIQKEDARLFSIFYQKLTLDEPYLLVYSFENK